MIATLGALVLSALVAPVPTPAPYGPSAAPTATASRATVAAPATTAPSATTTPSATPTDEYIRRGPASAPRMINSSHAAGDATIVDSGSTNALGFTIVVHPDFSADVTAGGSTERKMVGRPQARWLFAKLRAARPLAGLPHGGCMKSMSFGSTLTIAYAGETTPDLSCDGDSTTRELGRTVSVIVDQLQIPMRRTRGVQIR